MPTISRKAILPYSAAEMYELVDAIEDYPQFLQWCEKSEVHQRSVDEVEATLHLLKGGIRKSFTTRNRLQKNKMIEVRLVNGPFHHLEGFWRFEALDQQACTVMFDLEFEFSGKMLSMILAPIFSQISNTMVDAFIVRAEEIYGKRQL